MSDERKETAIRTRKRVGGWVHFAIAAAILASMTILWSHTMRAMNWATQKESVPWPAGILVDPDELRWTNLPDRIANRFVIAADGEFPWSDNGTLPDGEIILKDDVKEILGIGTSWDKSRYGRRESNWHVVRIYRDTRVPPGHPRRYWRLEVCYYTGRLDTVPHVPERCVRAAGATVTSSGKVTFSVPTVPAARRLWDKPLSFRRVDYERTNTYGITSRHATYYIFSLNGKPENSWEQVRLTLAYPWIRRCYFAKIQFGPEGSVSNMEDTDLAAEDFMNYFLPVILRALPSDVDVAADSPGAEG